jgi:hypothetical protein
MSSRCSYFGIFFAEWMAIFAVRFLDTPSCYTIAAQNIFAQRNCFQVVRIKTQGLPAEMVDCQAAWNRASVQFVTYPMNSVISVINADSSIGDFTIVPTG